MFLLFHHRKIELSISTEMGLGNIQPPGLWPKGSLRLLHFLQKGQPLVRPTMTQTGRRHLPVYQVHTDQNCLSEQTGLGHSLPRHETKWERKEILSGKSWVEQSRQVSHSKDGFSKARESVKSVRRHKPRGLGWRGHRLSSTSLLPSIMNLIFDWNTL